MKTAANAHLAVEQIVAESWRPVPGYYGLYEVSNLGRVRSLKQHGGNGVMRRAAPLILRQRISSGGYLRVSLSIDSRPTLHLVHRLVLSAFVGECPPGHESCHLDGMAANNRVTNLVWGSRELNNAHRTMHGRLRGAANHMSKLNDAAVTEIRRSYVRTGYCTSNAKELALQFGVSKSLIVQVVSGSIWRPHA